MGFWLRSEMDFFNLIRHATSTDVVLGKKSGLVQMKKKDVDHGEMK